MKIKSVRIDSFGAVSGYYTEFNDGNLVLIYGDNEAGKSTITEFIRGTLFNGKNARYPVQHKTDKGYVEVEMDNGETKVLVREGRRVFEKESRTLPADVLKMNADTYRSLFSFDIEQIDDDRMITNGEFRRKFLTVPGGERVPEVSQAISDSMSVLSSKERLTDTRELGRLKKKLKEAEDLIAKYSVRTEGYNALVARREKLGRDLDEARLLQDREAYEKNRAFMYESMKENTAKLEELRKRRDEISHVESLTDEDIRQYDELRMRLVTLDGLIESGETDENLDEEMTAEEARNILDLREDIDRVWSTRARMEILEGAITDLRSTIEVDSVKVEEAVNTTGISEANLERIVSDPEVREILCNPDNRPIVSRKTVKWLTPRKRGVYSAVGLAGAVASIAVGWVPLMYIFATLVFAVNIAPTIIHGYCRIDDIDWPVWLESKGFAGVTTQQEAIELFSKIDPISYIIERRMLSKQRCDNFEKEMHTLTMQAREVTAKMKIGTGSVFRDMAEMYRMYSKAKELSVAFSESDGLIEKRESIAKEIEALVAKYGGESEFVDMRVALDEFKSLNIRIKELESALKSANAASNEIMGKIIEDVSGDEEVKDPSKLIEEINIQIGEVSTEMRHIVNDDALSEYLVAKGTAEKEFNTALRQWAVYAVADHIIAECCNRFYSELQPTVVKTANRYLDLMTVGRYRLGSDPRDSTLFIEDLRKEAKHVGEWSSGLSDQVYLSIKLAIAKEMGTERLPIIIDDILVRFDGRRKQGACRALMEFAQDQQVIMFTCDSSLVSLFRMEGQINYVELH